MGGMVVAAREYAIVEIPITVDRWVAKSSKDSNLSKPLLLGNADEELERKEFGLVTMLTFEENC
jgi:hypothetical protein